MEPPLSEPRLRCPSPRLAHWPRAHCTMRTSLRNSCLALRRSKPSLDAQVDDSVEVRLSSSQLVLRLAWTAVRGSAAGRDAGDGQAQIHGAAAELSAGSPAARLPIAAARAKPARKNLIL